MGDRPRLKVQRAWGCRVWFGDYDYAHPALAAEDVVELGPPVRHHVDVYVDGQFLCAAKRLDLLTHEE